MYLKRLELHGFKTFADLTELEFTPGITAIVGPNGSGKSNVFDAIRWALGEMSFRSLRSGRMDDVIFGGSEGRRAMGQAEASLTINNDSGVLPVEFAEVTVTRRVTRGGDGEYFLNDTVCRLRDIQMMFLGTGLGGRSYSLIGQGQVDGVLNAGPEERRVLLEEAAGLARFKRRRREAQRRLEHAGTNLLRVADVLAELLSRLDTLREQAESASSYQSHVRETRELELALQVDDARRTVASLKRIATQTEGMQAEVHTTAASAAEVGATIDRDRARSAEVAGMWEDAQRALLQVVEDLAGRESAMQILAERVRATAVQRERVAAEVERLETRLAQVEDGLTALQSQAAAMRERRDDLLEQLRVAEEAQSESAASHRMVEDRLAAARAELSDLTAARTRALHELAGLEARLEALAGQVSGHESKDEALGASGEELRTRAVQLEAALACLRAQADEIQIRFAGAQGQRRRVDELREAIDDEQRSLAAEQQVVGSTLAFLEDMQRQMAGYEQGAREILLAKRDHPERFAGIRYPVAELLKVAPAHRPAIEAALGRRLFSLITGTIDDVKTGVSYLRGNGQGSASFLPVELLVSRSTPAIPAASELVGRASDLVELTNGAKNVIDTLLGDVAVVTSLDAAITLRRQGYAGRIATLDGELLSADGVISVRGKPDGEAGLLGRGEQMTTLRTRLAALESQIQTLVARRAESESQLADAARAIEDADGAARAVVQEMAAQQAALAVVQAELARLPEQQRDARAGIEQAQAGRVRLEAEVLQMRRDVEVISQDAGEREESIAALDVELRAAAQRAQRAAARLTDVRVALAELAGTLEALHTRVDEHAREGADLTTRRDQLQGELTVLDGERHLLDHSLEEAQRAHAALAELQAATREQLAALDTERGALQQSLMDAEARWRQVQESLRELEEQAHRLEVRHAQVETELTAAQRRIAEEFGAAWDDVRDVRLPASRDEALGRIEALRGLIAALGPVNLRAVDEYQQVAARVEALQTQAGDLERARGALTLLIARLDEVLRVRFTQTFEAVNEEFNRLFVRLFAGGRARLLLVETEPGPSTALRTGAEPGIEIEAQLPGKKMRSLSALSGGERVLVALSLIFAMLRVHPSPFCIFDEVEAALDDANTRKFTTLLRELAERTQVLIITHNKGTMEAADVLYGVTMEMPGVSKIISMRLTRSQAREPAAVK